MKQSTLHRILTVDDNPSIHEDFRKLFAVEEERSAGFELLESAVFGHEMRPVITPGFELDFAHQGQEGLEKVKAALAAGRAYSLAFVDVRMPPGWDGVETIEHFWKVDPELQIVICTAYSDYSWDDMRHRFGASDSLLVLKKPFDAVEVLQLAHALTRKWELAREARASMENLDRKVAERTRALEHEMAERARMEEGLRQTQKMEAVGQLAAGIAHDFNNLLTVIQGHTSMMLVASGDTESSHRSLGQISLAADRAAALVRQLLAFSHKTPANHTLIDLNQWLGKTETFLRRVIGEHMELRVEPAPGPACLMADECNLDQVIMNLAVNARDAMPDHGVLALRTSIETLDAESVRQRPQARVGSYACLSVADTGCGMDPATIRRIFEPFFTTKGIGKGTGLGLSTVYGIVQRYNGWIEVSSQPGHGTTFKVFLPLHDGGAHEVGVIDPPVEITSRSGTNLTVLVVEDDPDVRDFVTEILTLNSYRVLEATDGVNALEVRSRYIGEVDLLLTDMVMPNGLSGRGLAEKLRKECSWLKVVFSSGYSPEEIGDDWLQSPGVGFIAKPFTAEALLQTVSKCLSSRTPQPV